MATPYGNRLREARRHAGMTQAELSAKIGVPQTTISTAERLGNSSTDTVAYANACGVNPIWLASGDGPMVASAVPVLDDLECLTSGALEIASLYDMIPLANRIKRVQAYNAATAAILQVLESDQPIARPAPDLKKQPV